jgi:5-methylcytosine-specific restriction enzyme subunit McrC
MSQQIPIQNIYYLLCYAWDSLPESGLIDISKENIDKPIDLLAHVLITGTKHLIRRGLEQGYQSYTEEIASIRGRILVAQSARRFLPQQGRALCEFDELTISTLPNQILKATLTRLSGAKGLDVKLKHGSGLLVRQLEQVDDVKLSRQLFRKVQLHGNNRFYRFILQVCRLIIDQSLMDESDGNYRFRDFTQDDRQMARLFERFLFNFYKNEQTEYKVKKERIYWEASSEDDPALQLLPTMETDISLRSKEKTLIVDAKYYTKTLQSYYSNESIHSANLYQIFSYLKNLELRGGNDFYADGMLLYPVVNQAISNSYDMHGHRIRIETIDLAQDWGAISGSLLSLLQDSSFNTLSQASHSESG